jgi:uncharacterized HAD superfamily protein
MRAKFVDPIAYCFDFDDTLVRTECKIHIYRNGKFIKSLTSEEFAFYKLKDDETADNKDFKDPRFIINARKYKMWPTLQSVDMAIKQGTTNAEIFILTARNEVCRLPIHNFLSKNKIYVPIDHIITLGRDINVNIAEEKKKVLLDLKTRYSQITFFDDNPETIKLISGIKGIHTRLVDSQNIY